MRATAQIKNLTADNCKQTIIRNLSRILDIRILDIDTESRTISFLYNSVFALERVKRELLSIGFPVMKCNCQDPHQETRTMHNEQQLLVH